MRKAVLTLLAGLCLLAAPAGAAEVIHDFDVTITVEESGDIVVTEAIEVTAEGDQIKRGVYRDLPFSSGFQSRLELISVTKNGRSEPYHTEAGGNGTLLYIGESDVFLDPGVYLYEITYRVDEEVRHFPDYDEIYWNVTGHQWAFPIRRASARILLPDGAEILSAEGYTGPPGARGQAYEVRIESGRELRIFATEPLSPGEGLTVAVAFPAGLVEGPGPWDRFLAAIGGLATIIGLIGFSGVLFYYWTVWRRVGKDPARRPVIPHYETKLPPAAVRFIDRMGFDQKTFVAALLSLAVKGHIEITESDGDYSVARSGASAQRDPSPGEAAALARLLPHEGDSLTLKKSNRVAIRGAESALKRHLAGVYNTEFFKRNRGYVIAGLVMTGLVWLVMALLGGSGPETLFMSFWLAAWSVAVAMLVYRAVLAWRDITQGVENVVAAVVTTAFSVPFVGAWFLGAGFLSSMMPWQSIALGMAAAAMNGLFFDWMKARTPLGQDYMDEIEGLRLYLSVAEKDRLNFHNPPERTPEHFEAMLPYALALGVEQEWAENFADVFARLTAEGHSHHPRWYHGTGWRSGQLGGLSRGLASSLASATAAKSSSGGSSGSFGGGFSGGGGGGGGGGGW